MNPGILRHPIEIQNFQSAGTSSGGFPLPETWITVFSCRAKKEAAGSKEYFTAAAVQQESNIKWTIRYREGVTADMQVMEKRTGKTYAIKGEPQDENGLRKELVLMTEEVVRDAS